MKNTEVGHLGHLGHLTRPAPSAICPLNRAHTTVPTKNVSELTINGTFITKTGLGVCIHNTEWSCYTVCIVFCIH